jgi:hypothetical protein
MRRGRWWLLAAAVSAAATAVVGCARAPEARFPNPITFSDADPAAAEKAVRQVLLNLRFNIEYPSSKPGRLTTEPLTGASWFEFWRHDTIGRFQVAESSLHTTRRRVIVNVAPAAQGSQVSVVVAKERLSSPFVNVESIGGIYNIYDPDDTALARQDDLTQGRYTWADKGRDEALEQYILERMQILLGSSPRS